MERTATAEAAASATPSSEPLPPKDAARLLDGIPQQRPGADAVAGADVVAAPRARRAAPSGAPDGTRPGAHPEHPRAPRPAAARPGGTRVLAGVGRLRGLRPRRLLPSPTGTPFTFAYAAVLAVTSLLARFVDPAVMDSLYQSSSTDVAHLLRAPALVLPASALWIAGGVVSPYTVCFLLVFTALERRTGGLRAAGVFLFGHVLATLLTEIPVGLAVLAGHLPDSALHRYDYGISYGVATGVGALAGLVSPWLRWPMLALFVGLVLQDLAGLTDPMTSWGHLISVGLGVATWPLLRRWADARAQERADRVLAGSRPQARHQPEARDQATASA